MKYLKILGKIIGIMVLMLLIFTLLITTLNYFNVIGKSWVTILEIVFPILTFLIGGFCIGKESNQNGWLEGLKLSIIFIIIMMLFNYLGLRNHLELKNIIYYLILTITCIFGSMIGINKKGQKEKR